MGNRSRYVAAAAGSAALAVGALARRRWRTRLGEAATGFAEDIMPSVVDETPEVPPPVLADVAHAAGHRHLGPPDGARRWGRRRRTPRPFAKHQHGARYPGRG